MSSLDEDAWQAGIAALRAALQGWDDGPSWPSIADLHDLQEYVLILDVSQKKCADLDPVITEHMSLSEEGDARLWLANMTESLKEEERTRVFVTM
jgi:hypothetical protein